MNDVAFNYYMVDFKILFIKNYNYLISSLTDLSASNDASMMFQRYIEDWNPKFPHS